MQNHLSNNLEELSSLLPFRELRVFKPEIFHDSTKIFDLNKGPASQSSPPQFLHKGFLITACLDVVSCFNLQNVYALCKKTKTLQQPRLRMKLRYKNIEFHRCALSSSSSNHKQVKLITGGFAEVSVFMSGAAIAL